MKLSKYRFYVPEYGDESDIPLFVELNIENLEKLLDSGGIIGGDIDCGCWDEAENETIYDGSGYDNVTGEIIDCEDYSNTDGETLDLGQIT